MLDLVRSCVPLSVAMRRVGSSDSTLREWRRRGKKGEEPYATFMDEMSIAEAEAEETMVKAIYSSAASDPRQAQWMLERRFHQRWSSVSKSSVTSKSEVTHSGAVQVYVPANERDG